MDGGNEVLIMNLFRILSISLLLTLIGSCASEPKTESPWDFPESALTGFQITEDTLKRETLFLLYSVDGVFRDTLWFKPQTKASWHRLFQLRLPDSSKPAEQLVLSCPGSDGHLEIHSHRAPVNQRIQIQLSDTLPERDFFRLIDRRIFPDSIKEPQVYHGVDVDLEVLGLRIYPFFTETNSYSGQVALKFSGLFRSSEKEQLHKIEGYLGAW